MASDEFVELQKNQSIAGSSRFLTLGRTSSLANSSALVDFKLEMHHFPHNFLSLHYRTFALHLCDLFSLD